MTSIAGVRKFLINFFNPTIVSKQLNEEIKEHRGRIKLLKNEYDTLYAWNKQYIETLGMLTDAIQAMVWKKDKYHKYLLANPHHCRSFFGFDGSMDCLNYVVGKSDQELINTLYISKHVTNTFENICLISDVYCSEHTTPIHFLEAGKIEDEEILLYIVKTPQFTVDGEFIGTIGMAWDVTSRSTFLTDQLNRWITDKLATKVFHDRDVFCYAIVPEVNQCALFRHVCPNPHVTDVIKNDDCHLCSITDCFRKKEKGNKSD